MSFEAIVVTCEHAGNRVPARYAHLFQSARARQALESHRGYDIGALGLARTIARTMGIKPIFSTTTRLLIELNRSIGHRLSFSEFSSPLTPSDRKVLVGEYYLPYRLRVSNAVRMHLEAGLLTLHLSIHSFTPRLGTNLRKTDIGLLYDPARDEERHFCARWRSRLLVMRPDLRVRRNDPYRGRNDGLTTSLRREFGSDHYLGIELEVNQRLLGATTQMRRRITEMLASSLSAFSSR